MDDLLVTELLRGLWHRGNYDSGSWPGQKGLVVVKRSYVQTVVSRRIHSNAFCGHLTRHKGVDH